MFKLPEGTLVGGKFRILGPLGMGGMGTVYIAEQLSVGRRVALKVMRLPPDASPQECDTFERRFFLEANLCAKLSHPNIVTVFDYGEVTRDPQTGRMAYFMAMELIEGETLEGILEQRACLTVSETIALATGIAKGLKQAHSRGLIHRDLKPANVMLTANEDGTHAKILDFGLVRALENTTHARATLGMGGIAGTPLYMSPEQMFGQVLTPATDLYSLGVVLYESLTGRLPFTGKTTVEIALAQRGGPPSPLLQASGARFPESLETLVLSLLSKEPSERPASADHILLELKRVEQELKKPSGPLFSQVETHTKYSIVRLLERRTCSVVYEARHLSLGRRVSIHVFATEHANETILGAELFGLSTLRHSAFPPILDAGSLPDTREVFMVMEELRGRTLRSLIREGALDETRALKLTLQLLEAIHEAHTFGFAHGSLTQDAITVVGSAPNEWIRICDLADRSAAARMNEVSQAEREQADVLSVIKLFTEMRTEKGESTGTTALGRAIEEILRPNGERTSVIPDAMMLRNALKDVLTGANVSSVVLSKRPVVWILNEDPAIDRLALVALAHSVKEHADVRVIEQGERDWLAANLDEDAAPSVILFGDLHIVLEDPLLARVGSLTSTQRVLISKGLNPELLQRSINFCGVDRHLCLPISLDDLRSAVVMATNRASEHTSRMLRLSSGSQTPARNPYAAISAA
jgi:serine/threonine protein kinase